MKKEKTNEDILRTKPPLMVQKTSNGYEIYYDKKSGNAVGIVWTDFVFLKETSPRRLSFDEAWQYCNKILINGLRAEVFPVDECADWCDWCHSLDLEGLYMALAEIGAENLTEEFWCGEYPFHAQAWVVNLEKNLAFRADRFLGGPRYCRAVIHLKQ